MPSSTDEEKIFTGPIIDFPDGVYQQIGGIADFNYDEYHYWWALSPLEIRAGCYRIFLLGTLQWSDWKTIFPSASTDATYKKLSL